MKKHIYETQNGFLYDFFGSRTSRGRMMLCDTSASIKNPLQSDNELP